MSRIAFYIPGCLIPVYNNEDGSFTATAKKLDCDGDGSGGNTYHDPDFQDNTTYQPAYNADIDDALVAPPAICDNCIGIIIGCKAKIKRLKTGQEEDAFFGDIGPHTKFGEGSTHLCQKFDPSKNPNNGFENEDFEITWWPDVAAEGRTLQAHK